MNIISGIGESGFLAHSAFSAGIATKDSNGNDITATYLTGVDLTPYQTIEGMTAYQEAGDYLTTADSGSFLTAVPDTYLQNTDLEISDNKITGISGIPLAAGGGVTGDFELSAGSGISIVDYPLEQKTVISVTAQGGNPEVEQAVIDNSATWNDVTAKQDELTFGYKDTAISSIDNSALYDNSAHARITTLAGRISDLSSNKLDTTAFSDVSGSFLTAVPDTYLQNTDLTIVDNKITEISGVPLSAGDELPSGLMNESAVEYNAVNEISGYNGSAISQYGAEKQWLQHDDTIVSISNSAQYAFGCNISALQRLMGIDETVLYSGDGTLTTAFTISEPLSSFERIRIYVHAASDGEIFEHIEEQAPPTGNYISYTHNYTIPNAYVCQCFLGYLANGLTFSNIVTRRNFWSPTGTGAYAVTSKEDQNLSANGFIYKVIGIGRKEV